MKINISIQQVSTSSEYTATNGCYAQASLTPKSEAALNQLCSNRTVGHIDLSKDLHCTIMYCKDVAPDKHKVLPFTQDTFQAEAVKVNWWPGHDKAGYLVLELKSDDLQKEHTRLVKAGCIPSFKDYTPHVTLKTPFALDNKEKEYQVKLMNMSLRKRPLTLVFNNPTIEDLKD